MRIVPRFRSVVVAFVVAVSVVAWGGGPVGSAGGQDQPDGYTGRTAFCVNWWVSAEANPELRRLQRGDRSVLTECIDETQADAVGSPSS